MMHGGAKLSPPILIRHELLRRYDLWSVFPDVKLHFEYILTLVLCHQFLLQWGAEVEHDLLSEIRSIHPLTSLQVSTVEEGGISEVVWKQAHLSFCIVHLLLLNHTGECGELT